MSFLKDLHLEKLFWMSLSLKTSVKIITETQNLKYFFTDGKKFGFFGNRCHRFQPDPLLSVVGELFSSLDSYS